MSEKLRFKVSASETFTGDDVSSEEEAKKVFLEQIMLGLIDVEVERI